MPSALSHVAGSILRGILHRRGKDIAPYEATNGPSIDLLPFVLERCALVDGPGAVIQIGANDGLMDDPVRSTIVALGLRALLVEPLPDLFDRLRTNYAGQSGIEFDNVAVSEAPGSAEIFRVRPGAKGLPEWVHGLASFDKDVVLKHHSWAGVDSRSFEAAIESVRVPVVSFSGLLERHPSFSEAMALQIDTEGHDFVVVRSAVSAGFLPRVIHYEHKHLAYEDQVACRELLASHGYAFSSNRTDTLAYRAVR